LQGIKPTNFSINQIKEKLVEKLKLSFSPEDWQAYLISRIRQGYDSIFCAGTGYGKSLIFEGLAALGGKGHTVIVISPLKALERDQVCVVIFRAIPYDTLS
jgi:superfamily II DNA helicase RecQ